MQRFLAVTTAIVTVLTAVLGLALYLGINGAEKYHLAAGFLTLVLVLIITHQMYYGNVSRKK
ncbi:hypothetical protein SAMN05660649_04981 [Desulfotomaculum arcticum]|uniref:Uncharacterized protein n=1 Tax=Desulfotruncus arcticus DSM 17038 TaxID=1121424 RepID=A0A1I2ZKI0_9FIRM|nr:hypothetical protein [Desulfotruncus arcticus]SFH38086.1 hypothetical protein SAMN05660649_04981 [Desulfotomaculum arcticum] [Desulfotruncus arcticus DSM 17038]